MSIRNYSQWGSYRHKLTPNNSYSHLFLLISFNQNKKQISKEKTFYSGVSSFFYEDRKSKWKVKRTNEGLMAHAKCEAFIQNGVECWDKLTPIECLSLYHSVCVELTTR